MIELALVLATPFATAILLGVALVVLIAWWYSNKKKRRK